MVYFFFVSSVSSFRSNRNTFFSPTIDLPCFQFCAGAFSLKSHVVMLSIEFMCKLSLICSIYFGVYRYYVLHGYIITWTCSFSLQFFLAPTVAERLESETNEEVQKEMLKQLTKKLPVQTRTISGCECLLSLFFWFVWLLFYFHHVYTSSFTV